MAETGMIDREALHRYVGRVLALRGERAEVNAQMHDVYEEAKNAGFVTALLRQIVREQEMEAEERASQYSILDNYRHALGMISDLPLGIAALEAEAEELGRTMRKPKDFAEQPIRKRPGRPRKSLDEMLGMDTGTAGRA